MFLPSHGLDQNNGSLSSLKTPSELGAGAEPLLLDDVRDKNIKETSLSKCPLSLSLSQKKTKFILSLVLFRILRILDLLTHTATTRTLSGRARPPPRLFVVVVAVAG